MKLNKDITSSRRKNRKAHFTAPSHVRRNLMSSALSKELRSRLGVRSVPIRWGDEVTVARGSFKSHEGKVIRVCRSKYVIYLDKVTREKSDGRTVNIGIHPSNVFITKLKQDKRRDALIERRSKARLQSQAEKNSAFSSYD